MDKHERKESSLPRRESFQVQQEQDYAEPDPRRESQAINEPTNARRRDYSNEWRSLHESESIEKKPVTVFKKGEQEKIKMQFIVKIVEKSRDREGKFQV